MAIRFARPVRSLIALTAITAAITVAPTLAEAAAPHTEPTVSSVQKQLGDLALKNTHLVEKYDSAQVRVELRQKAATAAQRAATRAEASYHAAHAKFALVAQAQYESGGFGAADALLDSSSDSNYLDRLESLNVVSNHMAQVVQEVAAARSAADSASTRADQLLSDARHQRAVVADARKVVEKQIRKYRDLLATLNAQQRSAYEQQVNPSVAAPPTHLTQATSAAAERAVQFALAQVGKPYVFGAAGPDAYDCSGLTMAAWQRGGVSLPHSAADQYNYGHHVSRDQLQPGDLIFFYQPIGHVTIYIGGGKMVSAPTEGQPVSVVPLSYFDNDYVGATRLT